MVKNPALIAVIHVDGTRLNAALCKYVMMSRFLLSSYMLLIMGVGDDSCWSACGDMFIIHMSLKRSRLHVSDMVVSCW